MSSEQLLGFCLLKVVVNYHKAGQQVNQDQPENRSRVGHDRSWQASHPEAMGNPHWPVFPTWMALAGYDYTFSGAKTAFLGFRVGICHLYQQVLQ